MPVGFILIYLVFSMSYDRICEEDTVIQGQFLRAEKVSDLAPCFKCSRYESLLTRVRLAIYMKMKSDKCWTALPNDILIKESKTLKLRNGFLCFSRRLHFPHLSLQDLNLFLHTLLNCGYTPIESCPLITDITLFGSLLTLASGIL